LHNISGDDRIAHVDASGKFCRIPIRIRRFKRLLNYFIICKDRKQFVQELNVEKSLLVSEMVTSRHTTFSIGNFFRFLKYDYESKYPSETLYFRMIVTDYSWATMHAIVEALNIENMERYAKKVYNIGRGKDAIEEFKTSWIVSCTAHTMHRFIRAIKPTLKNPEKKELYAFCFSLLLNCTDLETMDEIFRLQLRLFLSPNVSSSVKNARNRLNELIELRPSTKEAILKVIILSFFLFCVMPILLLKIQDN
jgi:hypothetical protein